jgi:small-conductance mechanosensitive channel
VEVTLQRRTHVLSVIAILIVGACLILSGGKPLQAQDERATVRLDGRTVLRVGPTDEVDAETRASRIEQRLNTLLENPDTIATSFIETAGDERIITVSGVPVVTITQPDAEDNLTTVDALAIQWSQVIDTQLARGRERRQTTGWQVQIIVESAVARLSESVSSILPRVIAALLIILFFWMIAAIIRRLMRFFFRRFVNDLTVENLIKQIVYYAIWLLGILIAINALGFDPQTVATGVGLTSLALGFALQDILSNFVSGLLILVLRPFQLGDQIIIGDTEGSVERIELRATEIRTYDGRVILVPNAELFTSRVTNNTAAPVRRGSIEVFLGYDADLNHAMTVMLEAVRTTEGVLNEPAVSLRIRDLGQDDIVIELRFWTDSRRSDFLATSSNVRKNVALAMKEAAIPLPDPDARFLSPRNLDTWKALLKAINQQE